MWICDCVLDIWDLKEEEEACRTSLFVTVDSKNANERVVSAKRRRTIELQRHLYQSALSPPAALALAA